MDRGPHRLPLVCQLGCRSALGSLTVFLVLTAYVFTTSAIFLAGVQLDEVLRKQASS